MKKSSSYSRDNVRKTLIFSTFFLSILFVASFGSSAARVCAQETQENREEQSANAANASESPFAWTKNFARLIAPRPADSAENAEPTVDGETPADLARSTARTRTPRSLPTPSNADVVLKTPSLRALSDGASTFFRQTSDVDFDALAALRLTPFRAALSALNLDAPAGIFVFCETVPPTPVLVLPIVDFGTFVDALGGDAARTDAAGRVRITRPLDAFAQPFGDDFAVVVLPENADAAAKFLAPGVAPRTTFLPPAWKEPILTLEATPRAVDLLTDPNRPFWRDLAEFASRTFGENVESVASVGPRLDALRADLRAELLEARFDVAIDDFGTYFATQTAPRPDSATARRLAAAPPASPVDFDADRFFYILPDAEAPVSGQAELAPSLVADLPAPFNRLRRVEYSLNLPRVGELAAESWLFYLEVDDAKAFVRELTVPNAKKIGRYVGETQASQLGAEIFGNMAARRQNRQLGRRVPPRNVADPQEAARRGAALGALIGGAIGESTGEKEALKEFDFYGCKAYVSDLETYVRQSAIMRADQEGKIPPKPLELRGDRALLGLAGKLVSGIENGSLEDGLRSAAFENERFADPTPLFARRSTTLLLDDRHLLVGLGNENFLRTALENWRSASAAEKTSAQNGSVPAPPPRYITNVADQDFAANWRNLGARLPETDEFDVLGAVRFSPVDAQIMLAWLRENYFPTLPDFAPRTLPADAPQTLWSSSVSARREFVRGVVPNRTIADVVRTFADGATPFELLLKPRNAASETTSDDDFDVDFGDDETDSDVDFGDGANDAPATPRK